MPDIKKVRGKMPGRRPNIICEIGLNYLGKRKYLDKYYEHLKSKNIFAFSIISIPDNEFEKRVKRKFRYEEISNFIDTVKASDKKIGISIADHEKIGFFAKKKVDFYKVMSGDVDNFFLIYKLLETGKKIYLSTGMANFKKIKSTLQMVKSKKIELIHTSFGKKINQINFKRIEQLRNRFKIPVSYGNHSPHLDAISKSVHYNPDSIFFYVKLNNKFNFPDNGHAVNIKNIDKILNKINLNFNMKNSF